MNMKKYLLGVVATGVVAMAWSAGAAANLVQNGSFESLVGGDFSGSFKTVNNGESTINNWTVGETSVDIVKSTYPVYDGTYAIDMAGSPGSGSLSQSISGSVASQAYLLSFWTSSNGGPFTAAMSVLWNGAEVGGSPVDSPAQGYWTEHTFTVYGTGTDTLAFKDLRGGNTSGVVLDKVSLTAVPLPPAVILFGSVLFGFSVVARKRNRSALAA